jgi:O-antigen/teichoic acid export membrane protein
MSEAIRARERMRRVGLSGFASLGSKFALTAFHFVTIPVLVRTLGSEQYGVFAIITSFQSFTTVLDFGISSGLLNAIAEAEGKEESKTSHAEAVSTSFFLLTGVALLAIIMVIAASFWIDASSLLNIQVPADRQPVRLSIAVFLVIMLATIPFASVQRIQTGYQEAYISELWIGGAYVLATVAVTAFAWKWHSLTLVVAGLSGAIFLSMCANWVYALFVRRPWIRPSLAMCTRRMFRQLVGSGSWFFVLDIIRILFYGLDGVIIARVLVPSAVTQYAVTQKLFTAVFLAVSAFMQPLWPAYREALFRGDLKWVHNLVRRSIFQSGLAAGAMCIALAFSARFIIRLWAGPQILPDRVLILGLVASTIIQSVSLGLAMYWNATNKLALQARLSGGMLVVTTLLKIYLCRQLGAGGVAWATALGFLVMVIVPGLLTERKLLVKSEDAAVEV